MNMSRVRYVNHIIFLILALTSKC